MVDAPSPLRHLEARVGALSEGFLLLGLDDDASLVTIYSVANLDDMILMA